MSEVEKQQVPRCESRFGINRDKSLTVSLTPQDDGDSTELLATALDLSRSGIKLKVVQQIKNGTRVVVDLRAQQAYPIESPLEATIRWCRPDGTGNWWAGCEFDNPLPWDDLSTLATEGVIERRKDRRQPQNIPAACRRQLDDEDIPATVINTSVGGFAVRLNRTVNVDEQLLLIIDDGNNANASIIGQVRWTVPQDDEFLAGCSFLTKDGYPTLRRCLHALRRNSQGNNRKLSTRDMLGLLAGTATVALGAWLLLRN